MPELDADEDSVECDGSAEGLILPGYRKLGSSPSTDFEELKSELDEGLG